MYYLNLFTILHSFVLLSTFFFRMCVDHYTVHVHVLFSAGAIVNNVLRKFVQLQCSDLSERARQSIFSKQFYSSIPVAVSFGPPEHSLHLIALFSSY
jgi:hypothetical protein